MIWTRCRKFRRHLHRHRIARSRHYRPESPVLRDYLIIRYFENITPGRNGGGWVDTGSLRYSDRFAEQLVDTVFAKAREMLLFGGGSVTGAARVGERPWADQHTSFDYNALQKSLPAGATVTWGRIAGDALTKVDAFLGKMGNPIGIKSYKPYQSTGEDFLHDYLGMIGIPIDLYPYFPTNASTVLLTECAKFDPDIVAKIKAQLLAGKSVVITSGLLRALQARGLRTSRRSSTRITRCCRTSIPA